MHNMLNQFYNYLSEKLVAFFENESLHGGERYYLQFDDAQQVEQFYTTLKQQTSEPFKYQHEQGSPYHTYALVIGSIKVVVAATIDYITPDFLVTLRNEVGEQKGVWKDTVLLSICHETLDSIRGGSSDLQKEGMPFHVKSITKTLKQEIEKSQLTKAEKEVAHFYLKQKLDDMIIQPSLFDFAEVLGLLSQGEIKKQDYPSLGLFHDKSLDQYTPAQMRNRLEENHSFFEKVQHIHEYENLDQQLEKSFDDKGVSRLKKDDWQDIDYSFVKESSDRLSEEDKKALVYHEAAQKKTKEGLLFWERAVQDSKAGQRKRHIIVFNPEALSDVTLQFEFDEYLKKEFIHKNSKKIADTSGKKFIVSLHHHVGETSFYRAIYKHKDQTKSTFEFNIAIVECSPEFLKPIQTFYEINTNEKRIIIHHKDDNVILGPDKQGAEETFVEEQDETLKLHSENDTVEISSGSPAWSDDSLLFQISIEGQAHLPFKIKDQVTKSIPVLGRRIWKLKREQQAHFTYENGKLQQGTREFYPRDEFKEYLEMEQTWLHNDYTHAEKTVNGLVSKQLAIPDVLQTKYDALMAYYKSRQLLPSLAYMDEELTVLCEQYVQAFNQCIRDIQDNSILSSEQKDMFKLGTIEGNNQLMLTPLHPLNVAYQLAVQERIGNEQIDPHILNRLTANNLLPFMYGHHDELYRPVVQQDASEWIVYEPLKQVTVGESSNFLATVIEEKVQQFVEHFSYLFLPEAQSPLRLNVVNITNDSEVIRGLFNFLKHQVEKKGPHRVIPLEVALYQETETLSAFEMFSLYDDIEKIEEKFDISLESKNLDPVDMLRIVRENLHYYKLKDEGEYNYAHISFYKLVSQDRDAKDNMDDVETGLMLDGLLSTVTSVTGRNDYRTGFGMKNVLNKHEQLIETAQLLNQLGGNLKNDGSSPYRKNESIVTRTSSFKEETLNQLYDSSYWVTFIDPNVDLEFFQRATRELLIIHYSDQYTSSDQYDAITVTDKSSQYRKIIRHYLEEEFVTAEDEEIDAAIRAFNTVNGEWLLRIIGSKGQFSREKLSIISAIKFALSFFDHQQILWVPISMEEILRVAGAVKLTKSEGVFSAKNLGVKGSTSDDLLLIGLEEKNDDIYLHYYPVEVKVGINQVSTIAKAKEQIATTRKLLDDQLKEEDETGKRLFKNAFFRNFFVQMFLGNAQKFKGNKLWPEKSFDVVERVKARLLNDDYKIGYHLQPFIGNGAVLSFKKDSTWRSARKEDRTLVLELTEEDAYSGVIADIEALRHRIQKGKTDISTDMLLANTYGKTGGGDDQPVQVTDDNEGVRVQTGETKGMEAEVSTADSTRDQKLVLKEDKTSNDDDVLSYDDGDNHPVETGDTRKAVEEKPLQDVRVLIGTAQGSTKKVYWEFGHRELANRHILISGKSGQGKTYFIQCLLMELALNNISSIIFDYTGGFKKSKLEPEFKDILGESLEQILVVRDKFPINPFKKNEKELDEDEYIEEDFTDIAERMKAVFGAVYKDLGIQQLNSIYQAIMAGLRKYGDGMNLEMLRQELELDTSGPAKTALSQLNPLIDKNPFNNSQDFDWSELEKAKGKVFVIQLSGFAPDIQKVITEFILWDLWHYKLQHGDQTKPLPVILDEAQNLDHSEKSPSAKILTEGRKYGWSGWYATQFLRGLLSTDEIARLQNSSQKIYFLPPENEISTIASNLSHDNVSRREWERRISALNKGQCISYGPMLGSDDALHQGEPVITNITSLDERINMLSKDK